MSSKGAGVHKLADKLHHHLKDGKFYEALQLAKTIYHRKAATGTAHEVLPLLRDTATAMLQNGHYNHAMELALLMLQIQAADPAEITSALHGLLPLFDDSPEAVGAKETLLKAAIK